MNKKNSGSFIIELESQNSQLCIYRCILDMMKYVLNTFVIAWILSSYFGKLVLFYISYY